MVTTNNATSTMKLLSTILVITALTILPCTIQSFTILPTTKTLGKHSFSLSYTPSNDNNDNERNNVQQQQRRSFVQKIIYGSGAALLSNGLPAAALVKGNAPPPKKKAEGEKKCTNVEECQEMAERLAAEQEAKERANAVPAQIAPGGTRYRDVETSSSSSSKEVKTGDTVKLRYKVLKLGKRSYDGLSGEGTVVFSRGYGLEDDEKKENEKFFTYTVGDKSIIDGLNDGILGMTPSSTRRIAILPPKGWRKPTPECDGGPGGSGSGGELKTDYVVVPTATMVATEICFDKTKLPFPTTYAQERRMAQRFDQSLIMEVELVDIL